MHRANYLASVRLVEEELLQIAQNSIAFDLSNLVAIFCNRENNTRLAVFNLETLPCLESIFEVKSLEQLLQDKHNLSAEYNGMVITFSALDLIRPDIITRGSRFYPIEQLYH